MSDDEWGLTYASPNVVSRAQHQPELPSRGSVASDDREWGCVYAECTEEPSDMLERTVDKPEAVPSDPSSCMRCDRDESDSECMAACCRRGFAPDPPQGTGAAAASASTPATAPPLQPKSGRAPKPLPSWGYTQNRLWDSSVVFPAGASNRLALSNVEAAAKWDCRGKFCGDGGCLRAAGAMRLLLCRQEFERQVQTARNADARRQGLHNLLASAHNLEDKTK